ncbi:uncharacterized protein LOC117121760 [Anneissia japonica]|uniref:uncharacterized protein LOC117121760 n=1 Tax=Anneissia japonica TaxID=1529436 RepID=UPI0014256E22|nr:uncharacterized protein LOC117121760 [Anneissia japonica]
MYFKYAIYNPFIDSLIQQFSDRFGDMAAKSVQALQVLQCNAAPTLSKNAIEFYKNDLPSYSTLQQELRLWKALWEAEENIPTTLSDTLCDKRCCNKMFPNITWIINIMLLTPVTSEGVERANSSLKFIQNHFRNTMSEDRFNALILLYIHRDIELDIDEIIDTYAHFKHRVQKVEKLFEAIEESHGELVSLIEDEEEFLEEEQWMERCQTEFMAEMNAMKINMTDQENQSKQTTSAQAVSSSSSGVAEMKPTLKLKRMELPVFDGDVKKYSRFKEDFTKFVQPSTHPDQLAFALRQALSRDPLRIIGPVEDEYEKMWLRLDERYGCERKLVEAIINEVENKKEVREGDGKKLIEFIDVVESSYRALVKIKQESEMSNMKVLGEIERKLPDTVFQRWVRDRIKTEDKKAEEEDVIVMLIEFLKTERKRVEYTMETMRSNHSSRQQIPKSSAVLAADVQRVPQQLCLIHDGARHNTEEFSYTHLDVYRVSILKDKRACFCCLKTGHIVARCWKKRPCGKNGCTRVHHPSVHFLVGDQKSQQSGTMATIQNNMHNNEVGCLLQVMSIKCRKGPCLNAMFDSGAMSSLITHEAARVMKARGKPVTIKITKVGGESSTIETTRYQVPLIYKNGEEVVIAAYGIEKITAMVKPQESKKLAKILEVDHDKVRRPVGDVNILVGYDYAGFHPREVKKEGHLLLLECRFGMCIGGAHPICRGENCATEISLLEVKHREFFDIESLGIDCNPRCGGCKCGKCPLGAKQYTLKEEHELNIIEEGLTYEEGRWVAKYPWIKDPKLLPDNRAVVFAKLKSLEARLGRNQEAAKVYNEQIDDMIERKVAREHCHRFLWRGLETEKPPKTYCVTAVNFGDKPSATIAIAALRKTAEAGREKAPEAADTILNNVYMDDVLQCVETREMAERLTKEVDCLLKPGNFSIKEWIISGEESGEKQDRSLETKKVLGICWKPKEDLLTFQGNFSMFHDVPQPLTKRICLSKINAVCDPLGLLTPVTVRAKILLRKLWGEGLAWDEPIKDEYQRE